MSSFMGQNLKVATFGESHGPALGVIVDGCPPGLEMSAELIQTDLDRRKPGQGPYVTTRKESDTVEILSGVHEGRTIGTAMGMLIRNSGARSKDYAAIADKFRPGHADYTYWKKYGVSPLPGGGRSSGRETAARVAAGAVARAILAPLGVTIRAAVIALGGVEAGEARDYAFAESHPLRAADPAAADAMEAAMQAAMARHDSLGGVVEVVASGVPAGWGDPVFGKLDALLAGALFSLGAVKGLEVGAGFAAARLSGSQNNDQMGPDGFLSNQAGGILGGISSGQDIVLRLAIKPTPSIGIPQGTVNLAGEAVIIETHGRHDPCIAPRISPVAEAMTALVLADAYLTQRAQCGA